MSAEIIIVIGASAGGIEVLSDLFRGFPATSTAAFFVTVHISPRAESLLPRIMSAGGGLPAEHPSNGQQIQAGCIYIAPPNQHLRIEDGIVHLDRGPRENGQRPSVNPMFHSAAQAYGNRVTGVLLSGMLDDGVAGLAEVKRRGGLTAVQDPKEAAFPDMPRNALEAMRVDCCLPKDELRKLLVRLAKPGGVEHLRKLTGNRRPRKAKASSGKESKSVGEMLKKFGPPSPFVCPNCSGPLWEIRNGNALDFRCLVGHTFSPETLIASQDEEFERALWVALRTLEERIALQKRLARDAGRQRQHLNRRAFAERAAENEVYAKKLRELLERA